MKDWILIPTLDAVDYTEQAVADCLAQTGVDPAVLVVNNGGSDQTRARLNDLQLDNPERVFVWHHDPPLPSLSATWNRMLRFAWGAGAESALVVNNDVRLAPWTYRDLRLAVEVSLSGPLFVSAVGVKEKEFDAYLDTALEGTVQPSWNPDDRSGKGGPDFSCFLLTQSGHWKYPFDENFIPAYCEDLDTHRRYMLGGDGQRIFSVNLPYLHFASRTLNQSEEHRRRIGTRIDQSRAYYKRKWGGDVNQERYRVPFEEQEIREMGSVDGIPKYVDGYDVTTPNLQRLVQSSQSFPWTLEEVLP